MKSFRWFFSYLVVATLGLGLAFAVSLRLMAPARSQEAPPSGDLPAEFLKEVENTQVPAPPAGTSPAPAPAKGSPAPSPANGGANAPSQVPPPPVDENGNPIGDGATAPTGAAPGNAPANPAVTEAAPSEFAPMTYDPSTLRDPFKAFRAVRPVDPASKVVLEPLQRFDLDRLRVVGILWDVRVPRAMVRDPDGGVHTVIKNSRIGRNEGFVAVIREGEVVVVETVYEDGKVLKDTRVMELTK